MSAGGLSEARLERMHDVMAAHVERGVPGLVWLVGRRGEVHAEALGSATLASETREAAPMQRDSIFRFASLIKPVTAAAAMILVEECILRLDDPVDPWLPELADRRVLSRIDADLGDTVPARRPISLRDLLTFTMGFGSVLAAPDSYPIQVAMREGEIGGDGPPRPALAPPADEWIRRLGALPLMDQPGERWRYNTGSDVLGILIARASGQPFDVFLRERLFDPLGMRDSAFSVPAEKIDRLTTSYADFGSGIEVWDEAADGGYSSPPAFASGAGGLVSTADDYLAFCRMLLDKGAYGGGRILSRPAVELMTSDQLTAEQRIGAEPFFGGNSSWGFGMAVNIRRDDLSVVPGRFGWTGGLGTTACTDPAEELIGILLTQQMMTSPTSPPVFQDFWTSAYAAIDD
jgi:CubicO group peptidase (beta-lactamase class C family)